MDENKNQSNIGSDNEEILSRRHNQGQPSGRPATTSAEAERSRRLARLRENGGEGVPSRAPQKMPQGVPQRPAQGTQRPVQGTQRPVQGAQRPVQGTQRPAQGTQGPVQGAQRPVQGTSQGGAQRPAQTANPNATVKVPTGATGARRPGVTGGAGRAASADNDAAGRKPAAVPESEDGELIPTGRKKPTPEKTAPAKPAAEKRHSLSVLGGQSTVRKPAENRPEEPKKPSEDAFKKDLDEVIAPKDKPEPKTEQKAEPKPDVKEKKKKEKKGEGGADVMSSVTKALIYMVIVTAISVLLSVIAIRVGNDVFAFVKGTDEVTVTIPENASVADVAQILGDNGIINYPSVFKIYCNLKKEVGNFLPGDYVVNPSMSYEKLRGEFKEQPVTGTSWITVPEGYNVDDIIDLMVENDIGTREKYIDVINNYDFDFWFIDELNEKGIAEDRSYRLEGYLFPDTYEFYNSSSEEMVINKFLKRFDEVYGSDFKEKAADSGYTTDQVLTIASYIQKEAKNTSDYMYVSSVIDNRMKDPNFPHLELDATIIYAIRLDTGEKKTKVNHEDTLYQSPYNTYIRNGLTPGPITNPGANAIRFALYPAPSSYYYYVSDNYGKIYYANSEYEHNQNIEMVKIINET